MFQNVNRFNAHQSVNAETVANQMPVKLRMPLGFRGRTVPMNIVVMELLWQQYGLDLLHSEVSNWLERNAPEVKALVAGDHQSHFTVGSKGTIEMQVSLRTDDRLREISSRYLQSQVERSMAQPELELAA
ncbi:MAG TPA: hypothetical protein VJ302_15995 [Blastocatellia bacterium]|nr:hypothetical protein [Blastocatellia bacterium]